MMKALIERLIMKEMESAVVWSYVKSITNRENGAQMETPL